METRFASFYTTETMGNWFYQRFHEPIRLFRPLFFQKMEKNVFPDNPRQKLRHFLQTQTNFGVATSKRNAHKSKQWVYRDLSLRFIQQTQTQDLGTQVFGECRQVLWFSAAQYPGSSDQFEIFDSLPSSSKNGVLNFEKVRERLHFS